MKNGSVKRIIPVIFVLALAMQLVGCGAADALKGSIDNGDSIIIELAQPQYSIDILGSIEEAREWTQLDQLRTYPNFRLSFDTIFNITRITSQGVDGKSGCMYVNTKGNTDGNTTLEDSFRNKVFMEKYWKDNLTRTSIMQLATDAYKDVDVTKMESLYASINAYYDLLPDNVDPDSFNANQSVTREQFYAMVFKASDGVRDLKIDEGYLEDIGGETEYSKFAMQNQLYAFLNTLDGSLDHNTVSGSISRAEAVYMLVNKYFYDELKAIESKADTYDDCKNGGDLALKVGFKTKEKGVVTTKENWQSYTLAYMVQNPNKGMQDELYRAMVVSYNLDLLGDIDDSRWDEPISKVESIELLTNIYRALNERDGYLTNKEYGLIVEGSGYTDDEYEQVDGMNGTQGPDTILTEEEQELVEQKPTDNYTPPAYTPAPNTGGTGGTGGGNTTPSGNTQQPSTTSGGESWFTSKPVTQEEIKEIKDFIKEHGNIEFN